MSCGSHFVLLCRLAEGPCRLVVRSGRNTSALAPPSRSIPSSPSSARGSNVSAGSAAPTSGPGTAWGALAVRGRRSRLMRSRPGRMRDQWPCALVPNRSSLARPNKPSCRRASPSRAHELRTLCGLISRSPTTRSSTHSRRSPKAIAGTIQTREPVASTDPANRAVRASARCSTEPPSDVGLQLVRSECTTRRCV